MITPRALRVLSLIAVVLFSCIPQDLAADPSCPFECVGLIDGVSEHCVEHISNESVMSDCLEKKLCDGTGNCVFTCSGRICMWA